MAEVCEIDFLWPSELDYSGFLSPLWKVVVVLLCPPPPPHSLQRLLRVSYSGVKLLYLY